MPPSELEAVLDDIGWSGRYLAKRLKCSRNLPWAWLKGRASVPPLVAVWLRGLAHQHRTRPAPDWRTLSLAS